MKKMKTWFTKIGLLLALIVLLTACEAYSNYIPEYVHIATSEPAPVVYTNTHEVSNEMPSDYYILPEPRLYGEMSVEEAMQNRRSRRHFRDESLSIEQISQLLWAAYGVTLEERGLRTTPSAGATYPLEIYLVAGNVTGLYPGIFQYDSVNHILIRLKTGDIREELATAALGQRSVAEAPAVIFYSSVMPRITQVYGERGIRYAYMELGHSAQNVYLQAEALGLGTVAVGAFFDDEISIIFMLEEGEVPLYLMPVGWIN